MAGREKPHNQMLWWPGKDGDGPQRLPGGEETFTEAGKGITTRQSSLGGMLLPSVYEILRKTSKGT